MSRTETVLQYLDAQEAQLRQRYFELLRIPSVSAQPVHAADCRRTAEFLAAELAAIGFDARVRETAGHPVVVAHHPGPQSGDAPHLLYYGHYDVQPAEPFELWTSPPFEPTVMPGPHGDRVVARGAVDDKGQVMTWLAALRAWHEVGGGIPARVTALIEGEEEVGSPSLDAFLKENAAELKAADVVVVSDTNQWDFDTPAISTRLRGMAYVQIDLRAASRDLHSGMYGGSARNPINLLTRILGELQDEDGRVQIPGFYDGVEPVSNAQAAQWAELGFDEARFLGDVGLSVPAGERGFGALERLWARPTCDLNGIWGGYTGDGSKTVIAAEAHAKLSCRLVGRQDPEKIVAGIREFVQARLPKDCTAEVQVFALAAPVVVPVENRFVAAAKEILTDEFGKAPAMIGCGGSIPVVESFRRILGLDSLLMGFGLDDDQVHSPNEKFEWRCLTRGARAQARLLGALAG